MGHSDGRIDAWRQADATLMRSCKTAARLRPDCKPVARSKTDWGLSELVPIGPLIFAAGHDGRVTVSIDLVTLLLDILIVRCGIVLPLSMLHQFKLIVTL